MVSVAPVGSQPQSETAFKKPVAGTGGEGEGGAGVGILGVGGVGGVGPRLMIPLSQPGLCLCVIADLR